jgi:hypothetical protein
MTNLLSSILTGKSKGKRPLGMRGVDGWIILTR